MYVCVSVCVFVYVCVHVYAFRACLCMYMLYYTSLLLRAFTDNVFSQALYFFKSMYLILSAQQCVSGYPKRVLGYFIAKQYNVMSRVIFTM